MAGCPDSPDIAPIVMNPSTDPVRHPHRPAFHFTPEKNWMNDPNGLIWTGGEYHLFYQHNPHGTGWGHMSWGHAVSEDLVHWRHLPVALFEEPDRGYTIFSGSTVLDPDDTSGLGSSDQPPLVAVYTADHEPGRQLQDIHLAYSLDGARTFSQFEGNPVIHVGDRKFGDPKVFWHEGTQRWVMVNILGWDQGRVVLYGSPDLKRWTHLSGFQAPEEMPGKWECPDLFPLPLDGDPQDERWVLKVSCANGWISRYWVGRFDGQRFRRDAEASGVQSLGWGDCYAEVTFNGTPDGRRVALGWIEQAPRDARPWTGMQSVARELTLRRTAAGPRIRQRPVHELEALRKKHLRRGASGVHGEQPLVSEGIDVSEGLELTAEIEAGSAEEVGFGWRGADGPETGVFWRPGEGTLVLRRSGREPLTIPRSRHDTFLRVHLLLDVAVLEAFLDDGETVVTGLLEPPPAPDGLRCIALGGAARLRRLDLWSLRRAL